MLNLRKMKNLIIIPDVHGRTFWREAVEGIGDPGHEEDKVVFLGDFTDPYWQEGIYPEEAYAGLEEIVALKRRNPDRVVLLLGNHDLGYLDPDICNCRRDYDRAEKLMRLFEENLDLFDLVHVESRNGRRVLFSHAGIAQEWVRGWQDLLGDEFRPERLNELLHGDSAGREALFCALADVSWYRGGSAPVGSPVWADVDEYLDGEPLLPGYYHVFGHSFDPHGPVSVGIEGVCVDCGKVSVFRQYPEGDVEAENTRSKLEIKFQEHAIGVRDGLYRALLNHDDAEIESLRDDYMYLRKYFYQKLGEAADDRILEKEWTTFLGNVVKDVRNNQR